MYRIEASHSFRERQLRTTGSSNGNETEIADAGTSKRETCQFKYFPQFFYPFYSYYNIVIKQKQSICSFVLAYKPK